MLDRRLAETAYLAGDAYTIADIAAWCWYGRLAQGLLYNAATFLQVADFYLVAYALAGGHVVVTHEVAANSPRKIKIPNVCIGLRLRFMTPYEMLRIERARFVLGARAMVAA